MTSLPRPSALMLTLALALAALGTAVVTEAQTPAQSAVAPTPITAAPVGNRDHRAIDASLSKQRRARSGGKLDAIAALENPGVAAVVNLRAIERLYRRTGREAEIPTFLSAQLARAQHPVVRNYIQLRLARNDIGRDDERAALDRLMKSLDENLARAR